MQIFELDYAGIALIFDTQQNKFKLSRSIIVQVLKDLKVYMILILHKKY